MTPIFDINKIRKNRLWAREHMDGHDFLFQSMTDRIIENLRDIKRNFQNILIIGERGSRHIARHFDKNASITIYDIIDDDDEIPTLSPQTYDCVICMGYLHGVNDVKKLLDIIKTSLKDDGLFLCSFFGGHSLQELRNSILKAEMALNDGASRHIHPMIDHQSFAGLLQTAQFALPVVDFDRIHVSYSDLNNLYIDLKNMGEGNALYDRSSPFTQELKDAAEQCYKHDFFDNGYITTFDILHAIGWTPHESQQQPAKRGSGQVSLTEIL